MPDSAQVPRLHTFRAHPHKWLDRPPLASSLQSFETALFLLPMQRYPAALIACHSAIESAVRSHLRADSEARISIYQELRQLQALTFPRVSALSENKVSRLVALRNRLVHYGYSPVDDARSIECILDIAIPLLVALYADLFNFFLYYQALAPNACALQELPEEDLDKVGLIPEFGDIVHAAVLAYELSRDRDDLGFRFCLDPLSHKIGRSTIENYMSGEERRHLFGDGRDILHVGENRLGAFEDEWIFNCPLCTEGVSSFFAQVVEEKGHRYPFTVSTGRCFACGFAVGSRSPYILDLLLQEQLGSRANDILQALRTGD